MLESLKNSQKQYDIMKLYRPASKGSAVLLRKIPERGVFPMDIINVLMLMVSFGMLVAYIMSDKNKK